LTSNLEEDEMPAGFGDKNATTKLQYRNTLQGCSNEIGMPASNDGSGLFRIEAGGTEV